MRASGFSFGIAVAVGVFPYDAECDAEHDLVEIEIAAKLPPVPGLVPGLSQDERVAVLGAEASRSRAVFIALHGDPFGCEIESLGDVAGHEHKNILVSEVSVAIAQ